MSFQNLKKYLFFLLFFIFLFHFFELSATTISEPSATEVRITNPLKHQTFEDLFKAIIDFLFTLSIPGVTIVLIYAGLLFITSSGDPKKIEQAKTLILYSLIGFVIIIGAKGLIGFLKDYFTKK